MITFKYNSMEHETGIIKGNKTKYFRKSENREIESISKQVNLGVNSKFNIDDVVVVLAKKDYDDLMANVTAIDDVNKLNETINELDNNNKELMGLLGVKTSNIDNLNADNVKLRDQLQQATNNNIDKADTIANLTETVGELEKQLTEYTATLKQYDITTADDLHTLIIDFRVILNYLSDCINAYENQGRFKRFLKENPTIDIAKPSTKLIDYRGNKYIANGGDIINANADDSNKSE